MLDSKFAPLGGEREESRERVARERELLDEFLGSGSLSRRSMAMPATQFGELIRHIHTMAAGPSAREKTDCELLEEFSVRGNEAAFAALVARHGPMVLRVCRRVLNHEQDAEDAFQAVYLVLAQNARSIRKREALAEWLHGVAYRTAMKAKRTAARRQKITYSPGSRI